MKDLSYYELRAFLYPREKERCSTFKLSELEQIWFCTQKNVKRKMKKFEAEKLLAYEPGRGRGNASAVRFFLPFQEEIEAAVKKCVDQERMDDLIHLLQLPIPKSWVANISEEILALFGLQSKSQSKDVLRSIFRNELTSLDPAKASITFESYLIQQLGDSLVTYDFESDTIKPHLAHHWVVADNHRKWSFYLRKGVRFHHQKILKSEDVLYTFNRIERGSPYYWMIEEIENIECPSPFIVTFRLSRPNPFFARYLSTHNLAILPSDVEFDDSEWIGTGPFRLKERSEKKFALEAFDHYFLERPLLDEVEFWNVPYAAARQISFHIEGVQESQEYLEKEEVEVGFRFLAFNFKRTSIVHHPSFREAMYHLLDVKQMYIDVGRPEPIEASSYFHWKSESRQRETSEIPRLLEESGYEGEELALYSLDYLRAAEEAQWLIEKAARYGVNIHHVPFRISDFYSPELDQNGDLLLMGEVASHDHHLSFFGAFKNDALLFRRLLGKKHLEKIDGWLDCFKKEETAEGRQAWIDQIEDHIKENNLFLYMNHPVKKRAFHPMIQDIQFVSFGNVDLRKLWIQ
ncbi:SgrR family transcriptional regulator [Pseudalkalibacillus salsuginis]|uniref:SgrR family transcriptional regulator n=1 Tax=Pseudalkalibacillus salsuginis TaxID=2910972 RepID=UPI001F4210ED|nr:SgrR family transcriptional regulator [Pseudalkalibacillus salsuginis]MCF6409408.1 SgrR family transcriptional regulator [Pseudalkalibacillus salsuginis]